MAIARALAMSPRYMLFDEATSALDPQLVGEVLDTMRMLSNDGMTIVVVTHEMRFARDVSDRVAFFKDGVIHEIGTPQQVLDDPQLPETAQFLRAAVTMKAEKIDMKKIQVIDTHTGGEPTRLVIGGFPTSAAVPWPNAVRSWQRTTTTGVRPACSSRAETTSSSARCSVRP